MKYKKGDLVSWTSQSNGIEKEKTGKIIGVCRRERSGFAILPTGTPTARALFNDRNTMCDRYIIAVRGGARNELTYYHAVSVYQTFKILRGMAA